MQFNFNNQKKHISSSGAIDPAWIYYCGAPIISVASSTNCDLIAIGAVDKKLSLVSKQGKLIWDKELDEEVWSVSFANIARFIIAGTANKNPPRGSIYIFNSSGHELFKYSINSPIWSVSSSEDARTVVASAWNNFAYQFKFDDNKYKVTGKGRFGDHGLYGIQATKDGSMTILAASDHGIHILGRDFLPIDHGKIKLKNGLYNVAIGHDGKKIVAGCRDGKFYYIENLENRKGEYSTTLSDRPVCGISMSDDGNLVVPGSFDGKLYLTNNRGRCFWDFQTYGEVWTTSVSKDGAYVCAGSGDQCLYFFENICTSAVVEELEDIELYLAYIKNRRKLKKELVKALEIYSSYGLTQYGITRSRELLQEKIHNTDFEKIIYDFIENNVSRFPYQYKLHRLLAIQAEKLERFNVAIHHNQIAAQDNEIYFMAMLSSGINFQKLDLASAARSCFRRAIAQTLDYSSMNILYNLARSYEDSENWSEAATIHEVLISWDINFRNSWERLLDIKEKRSKESNIDYTGVTVSLLGVDAPRQYNIAKDLSHISQSRAKELNINEKQKRKLNKVFNKLEKNYSLPLALQQNKTLEYDEVAYLKYDYLPSEDEIKKQLEMVYELFVIDGKKKIINTLDIGAATGRHPIIMANKGKNAIGIDIEARAMKYANKIKKQTRKDTEYPYFIVGDSMFLPFSDLAFDLVTCMMGTFAHIELSQKADMLKESYRVLNKSGMFIISTWDVECNHISFLSIYNEKEKRTIRANSISQYETKLLFEQAGFKKIEIIPFMMVPNVFIYELDIHNLELTDLKRAVEIDMSAKSLYPTKKGEMFMIVGRK